MDNNVKKNLWFVLVCFCLLSLPHRLPAQSKEAVQLLLNWQKLQQLRKILDNMYKGYRILNRGYNTIKDISEGNFTLHRAFLDGLLQVNPKVRDYYKVARIIQHQQRLIQEYKAAWNYARDDPNLTIDEIGYMERVYEGLFQRSLRDLDELIMVTTASRLRMSDDERLQAIDRIFLHMEDKLAFLRNFNTGARLLSLQRAKATYEVNAIRKVYEAD